MNGLDVEMAQFEIVPRHPHIQSRGGGPTKALSETGVDSPLECGSCRLNRKKRLTNASKSFILGYFRNSMLSSSLDCEPFKGIVVSS